MKAKTMTVREAKETALFKKYKELTNIKKETAFSRAYDELNDLTEKSQASACNVVLDFLILREKSLSLHELALLMCRDEKTRQKVRSRFFELKIKFNNLDIEKSCKRLTHRHVITDTPERLGKRSNMLT